MILNLHKKARTTPEIRREIHTSPLSERVLAKKYGVGRPTIRKWKSREEVEDRSHCPHRLSTTLSPEQEAVVVELRTTLKLSVDDLLVVVREFIRSGVSRSGLDRCLRRHGVSNLAALRAAEEGPPAPNKTFKDYEPGFVHVDVKYLPQLPGESQRRYLFVATCLPAGRSIEPPAGCTWRSIRKSLRLVPPPFSNSFGPKPPSPSPNS